MRKVVIIINGAGGVGKDTLCRAARKKYGVWNFSAVDRVKHAARKLGWTGGKDPASRKLLSDLKKASVEYDNGPTRYLLQLYKDFISQNGQGADIFFAHIREPEEIDKFKTAVKMYCPDQPIYTVLIRRPEVDEKEYGNDSDNSVRNYFYDMTFYNVRPIEQSQDEFLRMLDYVMTAYSE